MFLTSDNGLISAIFLRNLCVQKPKPVRSLRNLCVTIDQCDNIKRMMVDRVMVIYHKLRIYHGLTGGFLLLRNFRVAISVSPRVCFILVDFYVSKIMHL